MFKYCCSYLFSHFIRRTLCVSDFFACSKIWHIKNGNQNKEKKEREKYEK